MGKTSAKASLEILRELNRIFESTNTVLGSPFLGFLHTDQSVLNIVLCMFGVVQYDIYQHNPSQITVDWDVSVRYWPHTISFEFAFHKPPPVLRIDYFAF